ncbi:hypothetical protein ACHAXT_003461 [Thalassiosira profunda]
MKVWTKNNMRLLSKWRSRTRSSKKRSARENATGPSLEQTERGNNTAGAPSQSSAEPLNERDGDTFQENAPQQPIHRELFHFLLRRSWKKKLFTAVTSLAFVLVFLDIFLDFGYVHGWLDAYLEWMAVNPMLGVWTYILVLTLCSLIFVPPSVLVFAAGFSCKSIWGWPGTIIALVASYLGSMCGGLIGFWRAEYMTRDLIEVLMRRYPIIRAVDAAMVRNDFRVMVLMRLNPLIPFGVLNYVFGVTGIDGAVFLLAMVGILPWQLLLVCMGAGAERMYDDGGQMEVMEVIMIAMGIAFGIIGLVITWRFAKRELQKEVDSAPPPPTTAADYRMASDSPRPWRSSSRKTVDAASVRSGNTVMTVYDADLNATDYFLTQCIGLDSVYEVEYGTDGDANEDYQTRLGWNEILLDDFS